MLPVIEGSIITDERGAVSFVNDFNFQNVKRFYVIENRERGFIRAWHGHRKEGKYVFVVNGAALVGAVNLETNEMHTFFLDAAKPKILHIPPGYANGFKSLTDDTRVLFFATATLEESLSDSVRYPYDTWDIWNTDAE